jgi:hypothetical protein
MELIKQMLFTYFYIFAVVLAVAAIIFLIVDTTIGIVSHFNNKKDKQNG